MNRTTPPDWDASTYHAVSAPQLAWGRKVLDRLDLRGDETVLDAGCGTGRVTELLLSRLPLGRVIALDNSEAMLAAARTHLEPRAGERVEFVHADLQTFAWHGPPVDLVFSTATFHWVRDHARLFRNLHRALIEGGQLLAQCGGAGNLRRLEARVESLLASAPFAGHVREAESPWEFADAFTTAERLADAGFAQIETGTEDAPTALPDAVTYATFLERIVLRAHLPRLDSDALRASLLEALTDLAARDEPGFTLDYVRLNLRARRPQ